MTTNLIKPTCSERSTTDLDFKIAEEFYLLESKLQESLRYRKIDPHYYETQLHFEVKALAGKQIIPYIHSSTKFSPEGVKVLSEVAKKKGKLKKEFHVCDGLDEMKTALISFKDDPEKKESLFILKYDKTIHFIRNYQHYTSFYVKKETSVIKALTTDAIVNPIYSFVLQNIFEAVFNEGYQTSFHVFQNQRQFTTIDCGIFALRDAIILSQYDRDIFSDLEKMNLPDESTPKTKYLTSYENVPPEFMTTTQSMSVIEKYSHQLIDKQKEWGVSPERVKEFFRKINKHLTTVRVHFQEKTQNWRVLHLSTRYYLLLIEQSHLNQA